MQKVLFICKQRVHKYGISYGLINSCKFLANILNENGIEAKVVFVIDNNCIDREVYNYAPTHVFIEALWVVPSKFEVLLPLYPQVQWAVRLHSQIPFIAHEGIAFQWIKGYLDLKNHFQNIYVGSNNINMVNHLTSVLHQSIEYLPNVYVPDFYVLPASPKWIPRDIVDIGCFGSIRPLKNHLYQAVMAIKFAEMLNKTLQFHINSDRIEQQGESVLKNLIYLFDKTPHTLVHHPWVNHLDFIKTLVTMDLCMQLSFSETFNIVAADATWHDIPVIGCNDISWLNFMFKCYPTDDEEILTKLKLAYYGRSIGLQSLNKKSLVKYNTISFEYWKEYLKIKN